MVAQGHERTGSKSTNLREPFRDGVDRTACLALAGKHVEEFGFPEALPAPRDRRWECMERRQRLYVKCVRVRLIPLSRS